MAAPYSMSVEMAAELLLLLSCPKVAPVYPTDFSTATEPTPQTAAPSSLHYQTGIGNRLETVSLPQRGLAKHSTRRGRVVMKNEVQVQAGTLRLWLVDGHTADDKEAEKESNALADNFEILEKDKDLKVGEDLTTAARRDVRDGSVTDDEYLGEPKYMAGRRILNDTPGKITWTISPYSTAAHAAQARRILIQKMSHRTLPRKRHTGSIKVRREGLRSRMK